MAITDPNTVFITGAGCSVDFGLPLGGELIDDIVEQISRELKFRFNGPAKNTEVRYLLKNALRYPDEFKQLPLHTIVAVSHLDRETQAIDWPSVRTTLKKLVTLKELLSNQTSETIDDFIAENPLHSDVAKIAVSYEFFRRLYEHREREYHLKEFAARELSTGQRNWVHLFINLVRHGIRQEIVTTDNPVIVVTFNYDVVLEHILSEQFSNTERGFDDFEKYIRILHVHGACTPLPKSTATPASLCSDWAHGINVVNERTSSATVNKHRALAAKFVRDSREVFACGFAFSGPNCRLLELNTFSEMVQNRKVVFCNYDGGVGLRKSVQRHSGYAGWLGTTAADRVTLEEEAGSPEQPLGVVDWLRIGSLGEMPA